MARKQKVPESQAIRDPSGKSAKESVVSGRKFCFQSLDARAQRIVFITRLDGHFTHRVGFLGLGLNTTVKPAVGLGMKGGFRFLAHALRRAGRIGHQLGEFIQNTVGACRAHGAVPSSVQGAFHSLLLMPFR